MKIETLRVVYDVLTGTTPRSEEEKNAAIQAIEDELAKNADAKAAKADEYNKAWDAVHGVLAATASPLTVADIFARAEPLLPTDFGRGKVQYGVTHQWADKIVKIDGKPNQYRLK